MNNDGNVTLDDVQAWLIQLYFLPGDAFLYSMIHFTPSIASFFRMNASSYHGFSSGIISLFIWAFIMLIVIGADLGILSSIKKRFMKYNA